MTVKTLTIRKEVYDELVKLKRRGESFSDLLLRLIRNARRITILEGIAGTVDWGDKDKIINEIYSRRFERR